MQQFTPSREPLQLAPSRFPNTLGKPKRQSRQKRSNAEVQVQNRCSDSRRTEHAKQQEDAPACVRNRAGRILNREPSMPQRTEAVYSDGVLKPTRALSLRDQQRVRLLVEPIDAHRAARLTR